MSHHPRIVVLGGGSGPSLLARAFRDCLDAFTAIVCTTDTGSSTGICRRLFDMPAPGDLRATLSVLAGLSGNDGWERILEDRFHCPQSPDLHNMALGNLFLATLFQQGGDLGVAVDRACQLLRARGRLLPVTSQSVQIQAELTDGTVITGEAQVRALGKPPIRRLRWHGSPPRLAAGVREALAGADLIVMGPGCLYTSVLPCLLVEGVAEAIREASARRVYVCNTTTTPGQTDGFTVASHVAEVLQALGGTGLDNALLHRGEVSVEAAAAYGTLGVVPLSPSAEDLNRIAALGVNPLAADVAEPPLLVPRTLHKQDTLRHDPSKLRAALDALLQEFS